MSEHEDKIKNAAARYVEQVERRNAVKEDVDLAKRRLEVEQSRLEHIEKELSGFVGQNIPVRNIMVGRQIVRVDFHRISNVAIERIL